MEKVTLDIKAMISVTPPSILGFTSVNSFFGVRNLELVVDIRPLSSTSLSLFLATSATSGHNSSPRRINRSLCGLCSEPA
jgi:hypothetical protein